MAKELPYFRFTASEWLNDDISLESYELKGLFADICAFYWFKDCSISIALLQKRFSNVEDLLNELRELEIIKYNTDDSITVKFLDEQYDLLSEKRKKRSKAGRIGGLKKSSNAKAMLKQNPSYKDNNKDKDNNKELYSDFISKFNLTTGKKIRVADDKFKRQLKARLREGFTIDEILKAVENCSKDQYHIDNPKYLTPEFITRSDKLQKFLSVSTITKKKTTRLA